MEKCEPTLGLAKTQNSEQGAETGTLPAPFVKPSRYAGPRAVGGRERGGRGEHGFENFLARISLVYRTTGVHTYP